MINWIKTEELFSIKSKIISTSNVIVICSECNKEKSLKYNSYKVNIRRNGNYLCHKCRNNKNISSTAEKLKKNWDKTGRSTDIINVVCNKCNVNYKLRRRNLKAYYRRNKTDDYVCLTCKKVGKKHSDKVKNKIRNKSLELHENEKFRKDWYNGNKEWLNSLDDDYFKLMSEYGKKPWEDIKYREKMIQASKKRWQTFEFQLKMAQTRANQSKVSSIQETLYSILSDLGVRYYREHNDRQDDIQCTIGPYNFDCVIPRDNKSDLLIECQGDYWHSLEKAVRMDKSKASYIANNFSEQYELKYLWEHEFLNHNKIVELLKYWLGLTELELVGFGFDDIEIRISLAKDYKILLSKYHYLPNAGRGGISYGAYLENKLVAVCVFSPLVRQNIDQSLPCNKDEVRELSRLCIHPKYQKKNFGSWFISRCIKLLDEKYKYVISYCDTTFNHDGALYKACNFIQDREVPSDYWYVAADGWVLHKKTLYGHAKSLKMKESKFAEKYGYKKVFGKEKLRFIYRR